MKTKMYKRSTGATQLIGALILALLAGRGHSQTTYTYNYTGSVQTITLQAGNYSVQCWGGDGGNATNGTTSTFGGKGGFATGIFTNSATATFNIYVGGHGGNGSGASNLGGGGGGMSDIAPASNPTAVVIVAGGGGGATSGIASESSTGGDGGGLVGGSAIDNTGVSGGTGATGGSQSAGGFAVAGSFGVGSAGGYGYGGGAANGGASGTMHGSGGSGGNGGNGGWNGGGGACTSTGGNDHSGGGGAGYYGGGGGRGDGGAGGGGSSYIGGVSSGTTLMSGQTGFLSNPDVAGNGFVRIIELCSIDVYAAGSTNSVSPVICSGQSLTLTTNAISNYSWSTGATSSSLVVSPSSNTVYVLTATSPSNCTASRSMSVTVSAGPPVLSISNPSNNLCLGQTATLTASGALSYTWSNPGVVNGQTFAPTSTAAYTVTGANGCGTASAVTNITVSPLSVSAGSSPNLVCEGYAATLTAVSAVNGYTWEPGGIASATALVYPTSATVYTVTASDGVCSGTQTVLITTKTTPVISTTQTFITICEGEVITLSASGAGTGGSYSWTPGNVTTPSFTTAPSASTIFAVYGTNSLNCTSSAQVPVLVLAPAPLNVTASSTLVCSGASVNLSASGSDSYSWTNGPNAANFVVNPITATSVYTVTGSNNTNSCTATETIAIAAVIPSVTVTSPVSMCAGGSATITATGADTYTWNGFPAGSSNTFIALPAQTTTFVLVANTNSGTVVCSTSHSVVVNVNPNPTITVSPTRTLICKGETNTLTASGADTYIWQGSLGTGSSVVVSPTTTTTYTLSGTNSLGCSTSTKVTALVSTCNSINEYNNMTRISVYPNPNNGQFFVVSEQDITLNLCNSLGQVIRKVELNSENGYKAEVTGLSTGLYFIGSDAEQNRSVYKKLIVN